MRKIVKCIIAFFIAIAILIMVLYGVAFLLGHPDYDTHRYLKLYDDQEELYYQSINNYSGQYVSLDQVSPYFIESIIAIEDQRFYHHHGFDLQGIVRATLTNMSDGDTSQGASTISQQYARLLYLTNEKTWTRKLKEAFLTMQIETHLSKDEILEGYVNHVYFGHGIYGIENAAHYFYNKDAKDLSLNEASMLAGVINGPSYYSPLINEKSARQRQSLVLQAMVNQDVISQSQKDYVLKQDLHLASVHQVEENMSTYYYKDTVIEELIELGIYKDKYLNKGLNIYTSLNTNLQNQLNTAIHNQDITSDIQTAFMVVNPQNSQIQALVGGKDYNLSQYNRALKIKRQIGSTIKPLLYYQALQNGFSPTTPFMCEPTNFKLEDGSFYSPANYNNKYAYQDITLAQAIAVSDNIYALKTHLFLGTDNLYQFLKSYQLDVKNNASLALGTVETNIYNLANIYTNIASTGLYQPIYTIEMIKDHEGQIIYQNDTKAKQTLNKESCLILSQLLTGTFNDRFSTYLSATMASYQIDHLVACKTGSTDYDNLIVGYTPNILITGWVGYDDNREITDAKEKQIAKKIFVEMMNQQDESDWYQMTDQLMAIAIDPITGDFHENGVVYWFKKE